MTKVWAWLKRWGAAVAGGLLFLLGAGWLWRRKASELGRVKDELAVERAKSAIARLEGVREEVKRQVGEKDEAIEQIDRQLLENKRAIVEAHEHGEGLSDEEVLEAFRRVLR